MLDHLFWLFQIMKQVNSSWIMQINDTLCGLWCELDWFHDQFQVGLAFRYLYATIFLFWEQPLVIWIVSMLSRQKCCIDYYFFLFHQLMLGLLNIVESLKLSSVVCVFIQAINSKAIESNGRRKRILEILYWWWEFSTQLWCIFMF